MNYGWHFFPEETFKFLKSLKNPYFSQAAPHLQGTGENKDVFFWELEEKLLGNRLPVWSQGKIGACTSFGWGRASQDCLLVGVAKEKYVWGGYEVATEPIYGGSRVEVGGGWLLIGGSCGAWCAEWVTRWGLLFRTKYKNYDLTNYDIERTKKWGMHGVPNNLEKIARQHPVKEVAVITRPTEAIDALANYNPIAISGFTGREKKRDVNGFCHKKGTWIHLQCLRGCCVVKGNIPAVVYQNSWGDYLGDKNNKVQLESGREIILPAGCYLSTLDEIESDLRLQDSFTISDVVGFPINRKLI